MNKKKWMVSLVLLANMGVLAGCRTNDHSLDALDSTAAITQAPEITPPASAEPTASADASMDKFAPYKEKLFGTWENKKSKDTYTFDSEDGYSCAGENGSQVGKYSFSTDASGKMIILCLAGNQEIVNQYFKLTFDSATQISVMNGKGEEETWIRK